MRDGSGNPFLVAEALEATKKDCNVQPDPCGHAQTYIKYANTIPNIIAVSLARLNLWPSLVSKIIVEEI